MPFTAPAAVSSGGTISKTTFGDVVIADLNFLANPPACRVYHNTTQSLNNDTSTALAFNSERYDTNAMHDTVTNNSRISIATAGLYVVGGQCEIPSAGDLIRLQIGLFVNGTIGIGVMETHPEAGGFTVNGVMCVETTWKLAAGDYVQMWVAQRNTAGTARNVSASSATIGYGADFWATWIGLG